ncbi:MAG: peptidylprolyl isomerase [Imperialibacter sp.]|uniref:peptidylprolyl isomerase n=1 Tax=Imperialibacter sp. TaxID=2038411 RepID=UPI0032F044D0
MKPKGVLFAFFIFSFGLSNPLLSQKDDHLFQIGDETFSTDEFLYAFNKNRQATSGSFTEKELDDYFKLYVNFRLKVKEAKALGYDKKPAFVEEMAGYKKQLAKPYLTENLINEELVREAYSRTLEEVEASHILIEVPANASPEDTLKAYNLLLDIKKRVGNGESFATLAKQYSQDPSAAQNNGYLGYFGAFQMVYPFENAAFKTAPGKVSDPFKTSFGYHVVYVHSRRKALGSIKLAHIFFKMNADSTLAYTRATEVKAKLDKGEDWNTLVAQYSDEASNKSKGGELPWLTFRQLPASFYTAASGLNKPGDISEPLKAQNGWHIIKLVERKPVPPLEEVRAMIESRISGDDRASSRNDQTVDSLISRLNVKVFVEQKEAAFSLLDGRLTEGNWSYDAGGSELKKVLFSAAETQLTTEDFFRYVEVNQKKSSHLTAEKYAAELWDDFLLEKLEDIELQQLYATNPAYRFLYNEYFDGTLLFEVMNEKVWQMANTDTVGLNNFFSEHRDDYIWNERAEILSIEGEKQVLESLMGSSIDTLFLLRKYTVGTSPEWEVTKAGLAEVFSSIDTLGLFIYANKKSTQEIKTAFPEVVSRVGFIEDEINSSQIELLTRSKSVLEKYFNGPDTLSLKVSNTLLEKDNNLVPKEYWKAGIHFVNDGAFSRIMYIRNIQQSARKDLVEVKGKVVSDYQEFLETTWLNELKAKYPVKVNGRAWKNVVKQLNEN